MGQRPQNEEGRDALGNGTCQRHAHHVQMADDDEEEVEQDVQHARDAQVVQRLFRLANGAEDGVAVVLLTGSGFKDMKAFDGRVQMPPAIENSVEEVKKLDF